MARLPITSSAAYTIASGQLQQLSSARNRERQKATRSGEFRQAKQAAKKSTTSAAQMGATRQPAGQTQNEQCQPNDRKAESARAAHADHRARRARELRIPIAPGKGCRTDEKEDQQRQMGDRKALRQVHQRQHESQHCAPKPRKPSRIASLAIAAACALASCGPRDAAYDTSKYHVQGQIVPRDVAIPSGPEQRAGRIQRSLHGQFGRTIVLLDRAGSDAAGA